MRILFTLLVVFSFFLTGCGKSPGSEVLVSVGKDKITVGEFNDRIESLPERYREIVKTRKPEYMQELINDTLLYQEALRRNLDEDKDAQQVIEEAKRKILIARLIKDEADSSGGVTEEDIAVFYNDNKARYMTPEVMRASHIRVPTSEEAEKILAELAKGAQFEDVARDKSVDPTAQRGGDIGYFPKGQLMPEFEAACASLKPHETSGVVKTKLGYHIIKLTERRPPEQIPLEKVKDDVVARLNNLKGQQAYTDLLARLKEKTPVVINEEVLMESDRIIVEEEQIREE